MKLIWTYVKQYLGLFIAGISVKLLGTLMELMIPYILEHMIDTVAPTKNLASILLWGLIMVAVSVATRVVNVIANKTGIRVSRLATFDIRRDLFASSIRLSGNQVDQFGLPSLTSRMTSDSYNIQNFIRAVQMMGIRAPIMLIGGIAITLTMDVGLSMILCILAPIMIVIIVTISRMGIPLYKRVQTSLDKVVRVMRENITGIRVVKSLSKEEFERRRYGIFNEEMTSNDKRANIIMSLPGPVMGLALNIGLTLVVIIGARRVNAGVTKPGVILAFLTYFNMIMMGVMGINRLFMMASRASASAGRIEEVIIQPDDLPVLPEAEAPKPESDSFIIFDNTSFGYGETRSTDSSSFAGEERQLSLDHVSFSIERGGSLGIIGATGSGKTTIINLLMRFYDPTEGHIYIDGRDIRTYEKDELRSKFGVVFQNDVVFATPLEDNIIFGRDVSEEAMRAAAEDARAAGFIMEYEDGYHHMSDIRGANFSGGQKQRILLSRALAANPEILILDDASSALDYKTDADLRRSIREHHSSSTSIVIAQRVSSIMYLDRILMMDEGKMLGYGTHEELMQSCPPYREIYNTQMGEEG